MTESEAKTKWCPFARAVFGRLVGENVYFDAPSPAFNRYALNSGERRVPPGAVCMGSACMAWRWESGFPLPDDPPAISERYQGYCGLAGKP